MASVSTNMRKRRRFTSDPTNSSSPPSPESSTPSSIPSFQNKTDGQHDLNNTCDTSHHSDESESEVERLPLDEPELWKQLIVQIRGTLHSQRKEILHLQTLLEKNIQTCSHFQKLSQSIQIAWKQLDLDTELLCSRFCISKNLETLDKVLNPATNQFFRFNESLYQPQKGCTTEGQSDSDDDSNFTRELQEHQEWTLKRLKHLLTFIESAVSQSSSLVIQSVTDQQQSTTDCWNSWDELQLTIRTLTERNEYSCSQINDLKLQLAKVTDEMNYLQVENDRLSKQRTLEKFRFILKSNDPPKNEGEAVTADASELVTNLKDSLKKKDDVIEKITKQCSENIKKIYELQVANHLTSSQTAKNEKFQQLVKQCEYIDNRMKTQTSEILELRSELQKESIRKDQAYHTLMTESIARQTQLNENIKQLQSALSESNSRESKAIVESDCIKKAMNELFKSEQDCLTALKDKEAQLSKLKQSFDQLKSNSSLVLVKHEALKKERMQLQDNLKDKEKEVLHLKLFCGQNIQNSDSCSSSMSESIREELCELRSSNDLLKRREESRLELEIEVSNLKQQLQEASEEIEEVSKAFEESQHTCDELNRRLNEKQHEVLQYMSKDLTIYTLKEQVSKLNQTWENKLQLMTQQSESKENHFEVYAQKLLDALQESSASNTEKQELSAALTRQITTNESLSRQNEEMLSKNEELRKTLTLLRQNLNEMAEKTAMYQATGKNLNNIQPVDIKQDARIDKKRPLRSPSANGNTNEMDLLKEENLALRRRVICSVCAESFRDHTIIKCGHVFCKACLENNVKTRNRKCPQCKIHFDLKDVQKVYLD